MTFLAKIQRQINRPGVKSHLAYFGAFALFVVVSLIYFVQLTYRQTKEGIESNSRNEAIVLSNQIESAIRRAGSTTQIIADKLIPESLNYKEPADRHQWVQERLHLLAANFPELTAYTYFNARGEMVYGSHPVVRSYTIDDRDYFREAKNNPRPGLYFAEVLKSKADSTSILVAYRSTRDAKGSFSGVIVASIDLSYLAGRFSELDVGQHGMVSIRRSDDSRLVARWPIVESEINRPATETPPYQRIKAGSPEGVVRYIGKSDGVDRIFAYHQIPDAPFYILVGRAVDEGFANWRLSAMIATAMALVSLLLTAYLQKRLSVRESALRENEQRFRDLALTSADWLWEIDAEGRYTYASDKITDVLGYAPDEILGKTPFDLMPAAEATRIRPLVQQIMAARNPFKDFENLNLHCNGALRYLLTTGVPMYGIDGVFCGYRGTDKDITERKQAEDELIRYRDRLEVLVAERTAELKTRNGELQAILDNAGVGIGLVHRRNLLRCNHKLAELLGYDEQELVGQSTRSWYRTDGDRTQVDQSTHQRSVSGVGDTLEVQLVRKDGSTFWAKLTSTQIESFDSPGSTIVIITDTTLDHQIADLLIQQRNQAEAMSREKSDFLAKMSHEIRTPMNAIIGFSHVLRRRIVDPDNTARVDKILAASSHLLSVINDILDLSKIEAGKFTLEEQLLRIESIMSDTLSMLHERAEAKGLELTSEVPELPHNFVGDSTRLQQCLLNYANNAIKFTPSGKIALKVSLLDDNTENALVRFEVVDTGIGISSEVIPRLFGHFEQADSTTAQQFGGTGLGLAITKRMAELMGGEVGVQSDVGVGSTFWFTTRLKKAPPTLQPATGHDQGSAEVILNRDFAGVRVLLAEDNPINQEIALDMLEQAGLVVDVASDGIEAVRLASTREYQIVLMDMVMPNKDGLAATSDIRLLEKYKTLPILAMTANASNEDRRRCMESGMSGFITKPIQPQDLYKILLSFLATQ